MPRDGSATRERILRAALQRFTAQGYDKTSLREIADDVGVTKAALYYHFRTKDDMVHAAMARIADRVRELGEWAPTRDPSAAGDAELVERLIAFAGGDAGEVLRFVQANPTVVTDAPADPEQGQLIGVGQGIQGQMAALVRAIAGDDPSPEVGLRAVLTLASVMLTAYAGGPQVPLEVPGTPDDRLAAARKVAGELLAGVHG